MPLPIFTLSRGWIFEEMAEIYQIIFKTYADAAYRDLANNDTFARTESVRLERLQKIKTTQY